MRGKAQPDGRPAFELIETLVLLLLIVAKVHVQRRFSINNILLPCTELQTDRRADSRNSGPIFHRLWTKVHQIC